MKESCPSCEREFKEFTDYPRIYIASVTILNPYDIPYKLPHWWVENLLPSPKVGYKTSVTPQEVAEHFRNYESEEELVYDDYIYQKPYFASKLFQEELKRHPELCLDRFIGGDTYQRRYNWAKTVHNLLTTNTTLKTYLEDLQTLVGREIRSTQLYPPSNWQQYSLRAIKLGYLVPEDPRLQILLTNPYPQVCKAVESEQKRKILEQQDNVHDYKITEVGLWSEGPNLGSAGGPSVQRVIEIGQIEYQGRVNPPTIDLLI